MIVALERAGIPGGPINSVAEAIDDPQIKARGLRIAPEGLPGLRTPIGFSRSPLTLDGASPILGAGSWRFSPKSRKQTRNDDRSIGRLMSD
nr:MULTISPECIES: CoA transferase [unclassified Rhizobium]